MDSVGKKYEFVKELPDDFTCSVCYDAIYDAKETKCCGHYFCQSCSDRVIASEMGCPQCRVFPLETQDGHFMRRKLKQLHIYCVNKNCCSVANPSRSSSDVVIVVDGCDWKGEINDLQSHLNNHCPHATVTCQHKCDVKMARCEKEDHENNVCSKRPLSCLFCGMEATAEEIHQHALECEGRPVSCPNNCSAMLVQGELNCHLEQCPLKKVACDFEFAGCKVKISKQDYDGHMKNSAQKHIQLLSQSFAEQVAMGKKAEEQIEDIKEQITDLKKEKDDQVQKMNKRITDMADELEESMIRVNFLSKLHLESIKIIVPCKSKVSAPFYIFGYCMSVKCEVIDDDELNFCLILQPDKYDDDLEWPVDGSITLLLLNSKDSSENEELYYLFNEIEEPTGPVQVDNSTVYYENLSHFTHGTLYNKEYRLTVLDASLHSP